MRSRRLAAALAALLIVLAATSCGGGGGGSAPPSLRVVNAAYLAPYNFDVLVNSATAATDMGYLQATGLQSIGTGSTSVEFEPTGTTTNAVTASFTIDNGYNYSVLAVEGSGGLTTIVVAQNNSQIASGQARLTFVGAAPAVGTLDVFLTGPIASLPSTATLAPVSYAGDGTTPSPIPVVVPSGSYRIRAIVDGDATQTIVYDSGPLVLAPGADLLLAIIPISGSAAQFSLLRLDADSNVTQITDQRVQLRMGNFAPALVGALDTFLNPTLTVNSSATLFVSGLLQNSASAYQAVLPAAYRASFAATGTTTEIVGNYLGLGAGTSHSVFAIGINGQVAPNNLQLWDYLDSLQAPATGMANLRVIELALDLKNNGITTVDLVTLDTSVSPPVITGTLVGNLAYPGASSYVSLPAGSYTVALVPSGGATTPLLPTSAGTVLNLSAGEVATLVVAGCQYPGSGICSSAPGATLQLMTLQDN